MPCIPLSALAKLSSVICHLCAPSPLPTQPEADGRAGRSRRAVSREWADNTKKKIPAVDITAGIFYNNIKYVLLLEGDLAVALERMTHYLE